MYICDICNKGFSNKGNLKYHQINTKYCKKIKENKCNYCNKPLYNINIELHYNDCIDYYKFQYSKLKDIYKDIELYKQQIIELKQQNSILETSLQDERRIFHEQLKEFTLKLIDKPNNITHNYSDNSTKNTTNNTKVDIFNNLNTLKDTDFTESIDKLTIDHVKQGAKGYAEYSLEYPLKNKLMCVDLSRKKVCFKDENGKKVEDYKLTNILSKLFSSIKDKNLEMIKSITDEINRNFSHYSKSINEYEEGSIEEREYNNDIDYNYDILMRYADLVGDVSNISKGDINNKLGNEIIDIIINKIPKK